MERLLKDAEAISGVHYDISNFSDIVQAIHEVQTNLYISGISADEAAERVQKGLLTQEEAYKLMGTTAKEAATTIQGSTMAMKAAWENLLVGFARDDADLDKLISDFVGSAETALNNLLPRITQVFSGVSEAVVKLAPYIEAKLPELVEALKPGIRAAMDLIAVFMSGILPEILKPLADGAMELVDTIEHNLSEKIPALAWLFENLETVVTTVVTAFISYKTAMAITDVINGVSTAIKNAKTAFALLHSTMMANPIVLIVTLIAGLVAALVTLWHTNEDFRNAVKEIWKAITGFFSDAWEAIKRTWEPVADYFGRIWADIKTIFSVVAPAFEAIFLAAWENVERIWNVAVTFFALVWDGIKTIFAVAGDVIGGFFAVAWDAVVLIWDAATGYFENLWHSIAGIFEGVKLFFGGRFSEAFDAVKEGFSGWGKFFQGLLDDVIDIFSDIGKTFFNIGADIVNGLIEGVGDLWNGFLTLVGLKTDEVKEEFTGPDGFDEHSPSKWSEDVFRRILEGGEIGFDKGLPGILSNAESAVRDIQDALSAADPFSVSGGYNLSGGYSYAQPPQLAAASAVNGYAAPQLETVRVEQPIQLILDERGKRILGEWMYHYIKTQERARG